MEALLATLAPHWTRQPGATQAAISEAEAQLGQVLPSDYTALMAWSNGGYGQIGEHLCILWSIEELAATNAAYRLTTAPGKVIGIGSNGGSDCLALDYHESPTAPSLVYIPFIGFDDLWTWLTIGPSLQEGFLHLLSDPRWPYNR